MHLPSFNCLGIRSGVEFIPINIFCVSCFETKMFVPEFWLVQFFNWVEKLTRGLCMNEAIDAIEVSDLNSNLLL